MATTTTTRASARNAARTEKKAGRRSIGRGWMIATYVGLIFFLFWTLVPFVWMLLASLKTNKEIYDSFTLVPRHLFFGHYADLLRGGGGSKASSSFRQWLLNSAMVSVVVTALSVILGALAAYSITRLHFTGRAMLARGLIFTYLVPTSLLFIPLFTIVARLQLVDTLQSLMLVYPTFTLPFCTWMMASYFRSIPIELEESARVDGCNRLGALFKIVMPIAAPAVAVVAIFAFTQSWNEFLYALVFTNSLATRTVTVGLTQMLGEDVFFWGQMMAGALIAAVPPVVLYMVAQRFVIGGLASGGVKL
ncbi:MAG: carbohydrate ABC transporter permease [Thermomicrobia bacterium]|nr:carbohydrate ABC transporter permease [Thermomicrobia bacterium]MCA1724952.1 carbohydrate ABC transporter permease [Thermomicrobia bacterium]